MRERLRSADCVEKVWFEVVAAARIGGRVALMIGATVSRRRDRCRCGDQLGEFAEVLSSGGEVELVAGTARPA